MTERLRLHVTVQIEELGRQLVRARPLGPWRLQAVGGSWTEIRPTLKKRLQASLRRILPTSLVEGWLPPKFEQWETVIELPPPRLESSWRDPILVQLQSFRWRLEDGGCVVRVPAVGCTLFAKAEELTVEEVARQARIALVRGAEHQDLLKLRERFVNRRFDFATIRLNVPLGPEKRPSQSRKKELQQTATLRAVASDLTRAELDQVHGLDARAAELAEYLVGATPHSVLIVGPAGVGKGALVHQLVAARGALGLADRKIWATSGSRIVSGMAGLGMWQERCAKLIREAQRTRGIVHVGSLFELLEAGKIDGQPGVASMIRQAVAQGRLLAIAECTPEQVALIERDDPMLLRAFSRLELTEPPVEQVKQILRAEADAQLPRSQVAFTDEAIEELTRLVSRFASYSAMPATPLRLMQHLRESLSDQHQAARDAAERVTVTAADVARAFSSQTGLPEFLIDDSVHLDLDSIRATLARQVIGQAEPVDLIVDLLATLKARLVRPGRPLASLLFIGPTGVGKTEMAKALARLLYSDAKRMLRIDMSEYASPWSVVKLIGKPGDGDGALTSPIREQPFSVVLLDEFEKADPAVFDILLQLLGDGRLTDSRGRLADFRNAVVIMTSNLGADSFREANFGFADGESNGWREHFEREVRRFVRPEFLGRLDRIVPFQPLSREVVRQITLRELELLQQRTGLKYSDASLEFTPEAIDLLCQAGYEPKYGARPLRRAIERFVTVPLANALSELSPDATWNFKLVPAGAASLKVEPQRVSTKTKSFKALESETISGWQALGTMARLAARCGPRRDLENEMDRRLRHIEILRKRMQTADGPSRIAAAKDQLHRHQREVHTAQQILANLQHIVDQINHRQIQLMTRWYENAEVDWSAFNRRRVDLQTQLRQSVDDIVHGALTGGDSLTLLVTGRGPAQLLLLWKAYRLLAQQQQWAIDSFSVQAYDPLRDPASTEYRRRASERKAAVAADGEVDFRMQQEPRSADEPRAAVDLFRHPSSHDLELGQASTLGFAIHLQGPGVHSWLGAEAGIVHFFDAAASGSKRRTRFRVDVLPGPPSSTFLPDNWPEPTAGPERDPRKLISTDAQRINGFFQLSVGYAQGKLPEGLVDLITAEHEQSLWRAIGYSGIPPGAQLHAAPSESPGS